MKLYINIMNLFFLSIEFIDRYKEKYKIWSQNQTIG